MALFRCGELSGGGHSYYEYITTGTGEYNIGFDPDYVFLFREYDNRTCYWLKSTNTCKQYAGTALWGTVEATTTLPSQSGILLNVANQTITIGGSAGNYANMLIVAGTIQ